MVRIQKFHRELIIFLAKITNSQKKQQVNIQRNMVFMDLNTFMSFKTLWLFMTLCAAFMTFYEFLLQNGM